MNKIKLFFSFCVSVLLHLLILGLWVTLAISTADDNKVFLAYTAVSVQSDDAATNSEDDSGQQNTISDNNDSKDSSVVDAASSDEESSIVQDTAKPQEETTTPESTDVNETQKTDEESSQEEVNSEATHKRKQIVSRLSSRTIFHHKSGNPVPIVHKYKLSRTVKRSIHSMRRKEQRAAKKSVDKLQGSYTHEYGTEHNDLKKYTQQLSAWIAANLPSMDNVVIDYERHAVVFVQMKRSGRILSTEILMSSGSKYLDNLIQESICNNSPAPEVPSGYFRDKLEFEFLVPIYLTGG